MNNSSSSLDRPNAPLINAGALQPKVLEIFKHLSRIVSGAGDLQITLQTAVDLIRGILNVERCSILILDHEARVLKMGASTGLHDVHWDTVMQPAGDGVAGSVVKTMKPLLVSDAQKFAGYGASHHDTYHSNSFICVPMVHQQKVFGVINVTDKFDGEPLTPGDLELVTAVAGFLALVVHNNALLSDFGALSLRLHNTLNSLPAAILTVTAAHKVIDANKAALALAGRSAESFTNCPLGNLFPGNQASQIISIVDQSINQHARASREVEWRRPGQQDTFPLRLVATPFYAPESDDTIAIVQMEDLSLLRQIDELRQIETMHNNFLSLVSHELRTPLTSIKGATHLLQNQFARTVDTTHLGLLGIVSANTERMIRMVNQLIDVAQLQQGNFMLQRRPAQLDAILKQLISQYENQAENKHITILTEFDESGLEALVDVEKMQAAFTHLLENAIKFTPLGGQVRITAKHQDDNIEIHFIDNGIGIDKHHWDKVFGKFYQIEDPMTRRAGGAGLGLFLTRSIVLLHQGKIELQPSPGDKGTHIVVTLPVKLP